MPRKMLLLFAATVLCATATTAGRAASSPPPLVVGQVVSLSENGRDIGEALRLGLQIYFDHVNATGGIDGRRIELVTRDDKYDPAETVRQTRDLLRVERPLVLAGFRGTANALALINERVLEGSRTPLVGVFSGAVEIRSSPYIYHTRTTFKEELKALARTTLDLGQTRVAIFYQDDAFGKSGLKAFEEAAITYGLDLVAKTPYDRNADRAEQSIREAAVKINAAKPQAVFLISVADHTYSFISLLRAGGYASSIYSLSVASPERAVEVLGRSGARGVAFSQVFPYLHSKGSPLINEYNQLRARYAPRAAASYFSLEGFVNAKIVVEALRRASPNATSVRVNEALRDLGTFDLGKFVIQFSPEDHQGSRFTDLTVLDRSGRLMH